jgi:hypothetical protein
VILAILLAAQAAAPSAVEAERAFAANAQKLGQWTAFRKWAAPDALMFTPQPVNAHEFLKPLKDPPVAVFWWPGRSYVSCDGTYAVNTGPWVREWGKSVGYFTTVWKRQPDGSWKWIYDAGDALPIARAEGGDIQPVTADCSGANRKVLPALKSGSAEGRSWGGGKSADSSMFWNWEVEPGGSRQFTAWIWDGEKFRNVVNDQVVAAPPAS